MVRVRVYPWRTLANEQPGDDDRLALYQQVIEAYDTKLREIAEWRSPVGRHVQEFLDQIEDDVRSIVEGA